MREEPHLHTLDPVELLRFFRDIQHPHDLNVKHAVVEAGIEDSKWAKIMLVINNFQFICFVPIDWCKQIGGVIYMENCRQAWDEAAFLIFDRMPDWVESIYTDWVKNDTGNNISDQFMTLLSKELERLQELFKKEN